MMRYSTHTHMNAGFDKLHPAEEILETIRLRLGQYVTAFSVGYQQHFWGFNQFNLTLVNLNKCPRTNKISHFLFPRIGLIHRQLLLLLTDHSTCEVSFN